MSSSAETLYQRLPAIHRARDAEQGYPLKELLSVIAEQVAALQLDPGTTLLALSRAIRHSKAAQYDVAFRNWALHDDQAMAMVRRTDEIRLGFIRAQFARAGYTGHDLENRARLFYYYELADPMVFADQSEKLEDALVEVRHRLLTAPLDDS
jgi:hypothetical protein